MWLACQELAGMPSLCDGVPSRQGAFAVPVQGSWDPVGLSAGCILTTLLGILCPSLQGSPEAKYLLPAFQ